MTLRTVLIVGLAVVFGVAAAVYATNVVNKNREVRSTEKIAIIVTIKPVPRGSHLTADMLEVKNVAKEDAPLDALHSVEDITRNGGRVTAVELVKGDTVLDSKLAREGAREGMAPLIRKDDKGNDVWMQAATILTPTASAGVGGFIRPGDRVDVLLTVEHFTTEDKGGTVRLMQRVEVLATDNHLEAAPATIEGKVVDQREMRYVTLLVKPEQAQELALAQKHGTLTLSLRNPEDTTVLDTKVVTAADLKIAPQPVKKGDVAPAATTKEERPAPPPQIRVHRGGTESPSGSQ